MSRFKRFLREWSDHWTSLIVYVTLGIGSVTFILTNKIAGNLFLWCVGIMGALFIIGCIVGFIISLGRGVKQAWADSSEDIVHPEDEYLRPVE